MATRSLSLTRRRRGTMRFMLTPLVDIIFLLVMFFMLTSRIAPYSAIPIGGPATGASSAPATSSGQVDADLVLSVSRDFVAVNGEAVAASDIHAALRRLHGEGADSAIVLPRSSATVQDMVTVLDALRKAAFRSVTVRSR